MDLPVDGATFTYTNNKECVSLSKLDKFQFSALGGIGRGSEINPITVVLGLFI